MAIVAQSISYLAPSLPVRRGSRADFGSFSVKERPVLLYSSFCSFYSLFILFNSAFLFRETIILGHPSAFCRYCRAEETASHFVSLLRDNLRLSVSIRESTVVLAVTFEKRETREAYHVWKREKNLSLDWDSFASFGRVLDHCCSFGWLFLSSRVRRKRKLLLLK